MEEIKCISEAFSMQPFYHTITDPEKRSKTNPENDIKRIEKVRVDQYEYVYEGYNFEGKKMFRFLEKSVNVYYK